MTTKTLAVADALDAMADLSDRIEDADPDDLRRIARGLALHGERLALIALGIDEHPPRLAMH